MHASFSLKTPNRNENGNTMQAKGVKVEGFQNSKADSWFQDGKAFEYIKHFL